MRAFVWMVAVVLAILGSTTHADVADVPTLLQRKDYAAVEQLLGGVQQRFESGAATEIELRNAFRPVYDLDPLAAANLAAWAQNAPRSYIAHLAFGIHLKRRGLDARGSKFIAETSEENLRSMEHQLVDAQAQIVTSLSLTERPYLSIFHLLDIATHIGDRRSAQSLIAAANKLLPLNALARSRYIVSLMPRWGGSYSEADEFIDRTRSEHVPDSVIWQLEAIKSDDLGHQLAEDGADAEAQQHYRRALELGDKVGGTFSADFLPASLCYVSSRCR